MLTITGLDGQQDIDEPSVYIDATGRTSESVERDPSQTKDPLQTHRHGPTPDS